MGDEGGPPSDQLLGDEMDIDTAVDDELQLALMLSMQQVQYMHHFNSTQTGLYLL